MKFTVKGSSQTTVYGTDTKTLEKKTLSLSLIFAIPLQILDYKITFVMIEQVALNKSSLLLKIQEQNTQTFTKIIKTESIYKSN